jgi:hypothetical protein
MKLDIQTQTEKQSFTGLLLAFNFAMGALQFTLLLVQFFYSPQYYAMTWAFLVLTSLAVAYFNLRFFRQQFKLKSIWRWLKQHP